MRRKIWIIIGIGIFAIVLGYLIMTYTQLAAEHRALSSRLALAEDRVPARTAEKEDLESQRAAASNRVGEAERSFPRTIHSIEYGEHIFEIIRASNLGITGLTFPRPGSRQEGDATYSTVSLTLPLSGKLSDIFGFIQVLRTDPRFASTQVNSISLSLTGDTASATIAVDIYGYGR